MKKVIIIGTILICPLLFDPVTAYIGPGAGLTAIGSLLALIAAIFFAVVGFLWYPIKRIFRKKEDENQKQDENNQEKQDKSTQE